MRRCVAFVTVALTSMLLIVSSVVAEPGTGGGPNNIVVVQNQTDGSVRARSSVQIAPDGGPIAGNTNLATAEASCTDCTTVAVAVQVVLLARDVSTFAPGNAAGASNSGCSGCQTLAYARQEVLATDRHIPMSPDAIAQVHAIEAEMQNWATSGAPHSEIAVNLDDLSEQLIGVVLGEVERAGTTATRVSHRQVEENGG